MYATNRVNEEKFFYAYSPSKTSRLEYDWKWEKYISEIVQKKLEWCMTVSKNFASPHEFSCQTLP